MKQREEIIAIPHLNSGIFDIKTQKQDIHQKRAYSKSKDISTYNCWWIALSTNSIIKCDI